MPETDREKLIKQVVRMYNQFNIGYDNAIFVLTQCGLTPAQADAKLFAPQGSP